MEAAAPRLTTPQLSFVMGASLPAAPLPEPRFPAAAGSEGSIGRAHRAAVTAETPVEADQHLVEIAPDLGVGAGDSAQVREENALVLHEDVVPLDEQRK